MSDRPARSTTEIRQQTGLGTVLRRWGELDDYRPWDEPGADPQRDVEMWLNWAKATGSSRFPQPADTGGKPG